MKDDKGYSFVVYDAPEIDLQRVIRENEGADAILVISGNALLMLRNEFLAKFKTADLVEVYNSCLNKNWGITDVQVLYEANAAWFSRLYTISANTISGYRAVFLTKCQLGGVRKQIKAAREFERKMFIHVEQL